MLILSHTNVEDVATSGRPKEAVPDENIKKVHKIILSDRKVKLIEIAETLKISEKRVEHIVHEYLNMQKRVDDSEQCLAIFNRNKDGFPSIYYNVCNMAVSQHSRVQSTVSRVD
jgi:hypothetical protein